MPGQTTEIDVPVTTQPIAIDAPVTIERPVFGCVSGDITIIGGADTGLGDFTAEEAIGGGRFVSITPAGEIEAADYLEESKIANAFIIAAVSEDASVTVYSEGKMTGLSGILPGESYFLGASGTFTTTPPATGFVQQVGVGIDTSTLDVEIGSPMFRA